MQKVCPVCGKTFITDNKRKYCTNLCAKQFSYYKPKPRKTKKDTLCWTCQNACGGCSWSRSFKPVKGWEAKKTVIKHQRSEGCKAPFIYDDSYLVINCPEYKMDEDLIKRTKKIKKMRYLLDESN